MTTETRSVEPMTPNAKAENPLPLPVMSPSPNMKRKVVDERIGDNDKENASVEKRAKVEPSACPLVELKGRKLLFKQAALTRDLPARRLLEFSVFLLKEVEEQKVVTEIPEEFWGLVVMAGHELSSSNESLFLKHLKSALNVAKGAQDTLATEALSKLIPKLFELKQYGLLPSDFSPSSSTVKIPATLQIRCWEAIEVDQYFSADQVATLGARRIEREQARAQCVEILDGLDDIEKLELIKGDKLDKEKIDKSSRQVKEKPAKVEKTETIEEIEESPLVNRRMSREGTANTVESRGRSMSPTKKSKMTPEEEEAARLKKEEREAKKAELAEKKAAKEREKERKDAAIAKQKQKMMGFFKAKPATPPISRASPAGPSSAKGKEYPTPGVSDYVKVFRPLPQRPHVYVAQINRWQTRRVSQDHEEVFGSGATDVPTATKNWRARDFINEHLRKHGKITRSSRSHLPKGLKTMPPYGTVAELYSTLQDAEDPRTVLDELNNRQKYPWKVLAFDQQTRPPYCGTFTKKSVVVGPRTPFAQDPIFDYSYDSSDDWQDDEGGEDVDDFGEPGEANDEEEDEDDEDDGEFDDFFDDDEDVEFTPAEGDVEAGPGLDQSRLPMKVIKKSREVPKKVVKLTPTWKGPVWEDKIGQEGSNGLEGYRIQLLNEAPHSIDPFTFISSDSVQHFKTAFSTTAIGTSLNVRCLLSTEAVAAPKDTPIVPADTSSIVNGPQASTSTPTVNGESSTAGKSRSGPKVAFPATHLGDLFRAIEGSTKIRTDLVSQLREQFESVASKAAIEQKIKEVAVRNGKTKDSQWRVNTEAWLAAGLTPPAPDPVPVLASAAPAPADMPATPSMATYFQSKTSTPAVDQSTTNGLPEPGSSRDEPMVIDA